MHVFYLTSHLIRNSEVDADVVWFDIINFGQFFEEKREEFLYQVRKHDMRRCNCHPVYLGNRSPLWMDLRRRLSSRPRQLLGNTPWTHMACSLGRTQGLGPLLAPSKRRLQCNPFVLSSNLVFSNAKTLSLRKKSVVGKNISTWILKDLLIARAAMQKPSSF